MKQFTHRPTIILGAGRSGTKMVRAILEAAPHTVAFPREINYIWRHGNATHPTDELGVAQANPEVRRFIRQHFHNLLGNNQGSRVVEKTCANSLRVGFVHAVLPEAFFLHVVRDGRAVAESARRRWQAKPELRYLLEKARWLPLSDIPFYGLRYLRYQLGRFTGKHAKTQSSWGPRFSGLDQLVQEKRLIEVCGIQWKTCVESAESALALLPTSQTMTVRYEDIVSDPVAVSRTIYAHIGLKFTPKVKRFIEENVHTRHLQKWMRELTEEDRVLLLPHITDTLKQHGYNVAGELEYEEAT